MRFVYTDGYRPDLGRHVHDALKLFEVRASFHIFRLAGSARRRALPTVFLQPKDNDRLEFT
jgi:hypothetical protein